MATRAKKKLDNALLETFTVAATKTATLGRRVKFGSADDLVEDCDAGDDGIGFVVAQEKDGSAGTRVTVALDGTAIVPVKVGTGGATRGAYAVPVADGVTNQAIADGTTVRRLCGKFMQSGVVGDVVGLLVPVTVPMATA